MYSQKKPRRINRIITEHIAYSTVLDYRRNVCRFTPAVYSRLHLLTPGRSSLHMGSALYFRLNHHRGGLE